MGGNVRIGLEDSIYLGKGGCHEAFAQSAYGSGAGSFSRTMSSFTNRLKLVLR